MTSGFWEFLDNHPASDYQAWPVQIVEDSLIIAIFLKKVRLLTQSAHHHLEEPPIWLFAQLSSALNLSGQTGNMGWYRHGLEFLIEEVSNGNIVVATYINSFLSYFADGDPEGFLDLQDAQFIIDACTQFQKGFNRDTQ